MTQVTATGNGYILYVNVSESSYDASTNSSVLSYSMQLRADSSPSGFAGFSPNTSSTYIVINGVGTFYCTAGQRTVNRGSTVTFFSGITTVSHDTNTGAGSWTFYGRLLMQNPYPGLSYMPPDMTTNTDTVTATTFYGPSQPSAPSCSYSGKNVTIVSGAPSANSLPITRYDYRWSTDNATWTNVSPLNTGAPTSTTSSPVFAATGGQTYYFQTRAVSTSSYGWGTGAWSASTSLFVPAGGKRWNGSTWISTNTVMRWNGASWVQVVTAKRWTGSAWADLS